VIDIPVCPFKTSTSTDDVSKNSESPSLLSSQPIKGSRLYADGIGLAIKSNEISD
jgi:hypothetical protein